MRPIIPSHSIFNRKGGPLRIAQSVYQSLNGGITEATPTGQDSQGVYNKFDPDNGNGVTLRIGANSSSEDLKWPSVAGTGLVIFHGLGRQPIGFRIHDLDGNAQIWRTTPPDAQQITLAISDVSISATIYIF